MNCGILCVIQTNRLTGKAVPFPPIGGGGGGVDCGRDTPKKLYKALKRLYKHINVRQNQKILDKYQKTVKRVTTNMNLTSNIKYPI